MDDRTKKLIAVGVSVGANCHPCFEYSVGQALEDGIDRKEIMEAVEIAKTVRKGAASSMDKLVLNHLGHKNVRESTECYKTSCCCS